MASASPAQAATTSPGQQLRCVICNDLKPSTAKLLRCMHIVCVACLKGNLAEGGCYKCCLCGSITSPAVKGVDLVKQLRGCCPLLYSAPVNTDAATGVSQECDFCNEPNNATHQCLDCAGALMCYQHSLKHPQKKFFHGHVVEKLPQETLGVARPVSSNRCLLHSKYEIALFCVTCCHGVCEQCVARGHKEHDLQDLASLVAKQLAMLETNDVPGAADDDTQIEKMIAQHTADIGQDVGRLQKESEQASSTITDTFEEVEKMLRAKRDRLLAEVDKLSWRFTEPLEQKRRRLEIIKEQYTTARTLAIVLASSDKKDSDFLSLVKLANDAIIKSTVDVREECVATKFESIVAVVQKTADLEGYIEQLVNVGEGNVDSSRTTIDVPSSFSVNEEADITISLFPRLQEFSPSDNPLNGLTATLINVSGDRQALPLPRQPIGDSAESVGVKVTVKPVASGHHVFELRQSGVVKEIPFTAVDSGTISFDPMKCSKKIHLSDRNKLASSAGKIRGNVMAAEGYTEGKHRWAIRIVEATTSGQLAAGVSVVPTNGDYSTTSAFFHLRRTHYWWDDGDAYSGIDGRATQHPKGARWKTGDDIEFTLDCGRQTLELHLRRTGERWIISNVMCDEPLYPTVRFCGAHSIVELVP